MKEGINFLAEFLQENNGNNSSMRLMSLLCVGCAVAICLFQTYRGAVIDTVSIGTLLGFGFGAKYMQKKIETKPDDEKQV